MEQEEVGGEGVASAVREQGRIQLTEYETKGSDCALKGVGRLYHFEHGDASTVVICQQTARLIMAATKVIVPFESGDSWGLHLNRELFCFGLTCL